MRLYFQKIYLACQLISVIDLNFATLIFSNANTSQRTERNINDDKPDKKTGQGRYRR